MNVLIINGHPRRQSFSDAIVEAYLSGITDGVHTEILVVASLDFNPNVTQRTPKAQLQEPAILHAQQLISWADHLVFVYPTWWGTMPALLKGFIDRVFTEGFAFNEIEGGTGYQSLLDGKTAQVITTMDTPKWVYHLIYHAPGHNTISNAILKFCGVKIKNMITLTPIKNSTPGQREKWLQGIKSEATSLRFGALSLAKRTTIKAASWLKAIRLQFYPMTITAYALGVWAAVESGHAYNKYIFWLGIAWVFFLEVATVLINEKADYVTDKENKYFSPFNGGSRVLVNKLLSFSDVKRGIGFTLSLSLVALILLFLTIKENYLELLLACISLAVLALGYTAKPLKLSYRTLGELVVGVTHSFCVILCGYLFMGGRLLDPFPWVLGLPLFLGVLPSITLAGIPDRNADAQANKKTLAVRFGTKTAALLAIIFTWLAVLTVMVFTMSNEYNHVYKGILYVVVPHAIVLTAMLAKYRSQFAPAKRIDALIIVALVYLVWFALVPLINIT